MEIKRESKKVSVFQVVLCIAVVALIAVVIYQNHRIKVLSRDNIEVSQDENVSSEKAIDSAAVQQKSAKGEISKFSEAMNNPGKKIGYNGQIQVSSDKPVDGAEGNPPSGQVGNIIGKLASEIQNNPAMESMIRTPLTARLNDTYGSFAEEFNLSPEKKTGLINLLAEKQMETLDMATQLGEMQMGNISAETLQKESEYVNNLYDAKISELLNPNEFDAYIQGVLKI